MSDSIVNSVSRKPIAETPVTVVDWDQLQQAAALLRTDSLVAFPTETVYGLGANADSPVALARLYAVKGRPENHPVIVHLASIDQLSDWAVDIPDLALVLAQAFWPGPLTLILKRAARVSDAITGGQETVGLRIPSHPVALALLQAFGGGVAAPSANRFGRLSPTTAAHVQQDLGNEVPLILDGGPCQVGVESTIVSFQQGQPHILRPGMITAAQIQNAVTLFQKDNPTVLGAGSSPEPVESPLEALERVVIRAPGMLASHYAPRTPVRLLVAEVLESQAALSRNQDRRIGVIARRSIPVALKDDRALCWIQAKQEPEGYARQLYAHLHGLDSQSLDEILIEIVPDCDAWAAVRDRLQRAAFH